MLSSHIHILNFAKPITLLPSKPIHGRKNPSCPTYRKQKCSPLKKANFVACSNAVDNQSISMTAISGIGTFPVKIKIRGFFPGFDLSHPFDVFTATLGLELVSAELDPSTGEKKTVKYEVRENIIGSNNEVTLEKDVRVPEGFGDIVGAVLVENEHHKDVFLDDILLKGFPHGEVNISCKSWVHSKYVDPKKRIFFTNKSYLPSETPNGLRKLRKEELENLRGNGEGERRPFERIYDYDKYNDLGDPEKDINLRRPVLGGQEFPYPRRCRTGRPHIDSEADKSSESRTAKIYVPSDETFSKLKDYSFHMNLLKSFTHALLPLLEAKLEGDDFPNFTDIETLFNEGVELPSHSHGSGSLSNLLPRIVKYITEFEKEYLLFEVPEMLKRDKFAWLRDEEFGRETLAGINPLSIQLVKEWPLKSESKERVEEQIGDLTVEEAINKKRLFMLDYHDLLMLYVAKVRELEGTTLYASRTLFFLNHDDTLRPIAIELTRPPIDQYEAWNQVITPSHDATDSWLWRLAKVHVLAHDSAVHQLVSHWLRAHCAVEPYIIATKRQLSEMHPIHRLLHPHLRYTMEINAHARESLIDAGGVIESTFALGKYCMELSSVAYDKLWSFETEALPDDLIKRGMAVKDDTNEHGLKLTIEDYPYANDGLLLWDAIKQWVSVYVKHYYKEENMVESDEELEEWWKEIRTKGHEDKKNGWPNLKTHEDLIHILTTIIWVASGHHAAVNFGQYPYAGYFPNRPTIARTNLPTEEKEYNEEVYKDFLTRPESSLLKCFPTRSQSVKVMATLDVLSSHSPDEEYIGETLEPSWKADAVIKGAHQRFAAKINKIQEIIDERNNDPSKKNRFGAGIVPYELLKRHSEKGVTGKGVPNSISI